MNVEVVAKQGFQCILMMGAKRGSTVFEKPFEKFERPVAAVKTP